MHTTDTTRSVFISVEEAVQRLRQGEMVLICDDEHRENEADLCLAAQFVTPEKITFILRSACGLLCVATSGTRLDTLGIPLLEQRHRPLQGTAFTASVDARKGTTTGISARDRAATIRALIDPTTQPEDLAQPGHVFPLRARAGGTLERRGHTEASVDLMRIAGLEPAAVICEVLDDEGEAARGERLLVLAEEWQIGIVTVDAIVRYRETHVVSLVARTTLPIHDTPFEILNYQEHVTEKSYLALIHGEPSANPARTALVRLHSACTTGDIFGSQRCDCQSQLQRSLELIAQADYGILLYLPQEGRNIGLTAKLQAYALQDQGYDTVSANEALGYPVDARSYTTAAEILRALSLTHIRLLTNNPRKIAALTDAGIAVERVSLEIDPHPKNAGYLQTKQALLGHLFSPTYQSSLSA